jgi:hypothetical protein
MPDAHVSVAAALHGWCRAALEAALDALIALPGERGNPGSDVATGGSCSIRRPTSVPFERCTGERPSKASVG